MSARSRYSSAAAFRMALDQRLRADARTTSLPLNRLRKEAAFNRLLVRLQEAAPGKWALKGGLALVARLGPGVRATKDVDANWRAAQGELDDLLSAVEELDLDDWFHFEMGDGRPLKGEGERGARRYPVTAKLDGRVFEQVSLDLNVIGPEDSRAVELVGFSRNIFEFVGEPTLVVPMVTAAYQLAEKLHAYSRMYDEETSSRAKDLFDMLVIADHVRLPDRAELMAAARETFRIRATTWPPELRRPPSEWEGPWSTFVVDYPVRWLSLPEAFVALTAFWEPIVTGAVAEEGYAWDPRAWQWIRR